MTAAFSTAATPVDLNPPALITDPLLQPWKHVNVRLAVPTGDRHSIHAYFNTCPESPDGKYVIFYTSTTPNAETGEVHLLERASGEETILARDILTEDAHRAACQQWVAGGKRVVYHRRSPEGRWSVESVDPVTRKITVLAEDRQVGFGAQNSDWVPIYGCHWKPGAHCDLELVNALTGEIRTPVKIEQVRAEYPEWIKERFGDRALSVFFPVMSPDGNRVFFKVAAGTGGYDFRSMHASDRDGKVVYDLKAARFVKLFHDWGHPSWHPDSHEILEKGQILTDTDTGRHVRFAPSSISDHPSMNSAGNLFVTDGAVWRRPFGQPNEWGVAVGSTVADEWIVIDQFIGSQGATSWRKCHPHPTFSADGKRIYYNIARGPWTQLYVAELVEK